MRKKEPQFDTSNPIGDYWEGQLATLSARLSDPRPSFEDILDPPAPSVELGNIPASLMELGLDTEELQLLASETPPDGVEFIAWAANHQ